MISKLQITIVVLILLFMGFISFMMYKVMQKVGMIQAPTINITIPGDTIPRVVQPANVQPIVIYQPGQKETTVILSDTAALRRILTEFNTEKVYTRPVEDSNLIGTLTDTVKQNKLYSGPFSYKLKPRNVMVPAPVSKAQLLVGVRYDLNLWATGTIRFKSGIELEGSYTKALGKDHYGVELHTPIRNLFKPP